MRLPLIRKFASSPAFLLPRRPEPKPRPSTPPKPTSSSPGKSWGSFELITEANDPKPDSSFRAPVPPTILLPDYVTNGTGSPELSGKLDLKSEEELGQMRNATSLAARVLKLAGNMVKPGITTEEIDRAVYDAILAGGGYPSPLGYLGFPKSICTSISNVMVHGIPNSRPLKSGDIINIDVTVFHSGFHGDTSATFLVGEVDDEGRRLVDVTREALQRAIEICGPGVPLNMIGKTISILAKKEGYTVSRSYCGHGVGRRFHELPMVYHHYNDKPGVMEPGMTFTIEPLLCQGSDAEINWKDGWTVASRDGARSAQFEHTILITNDGASVMTA